MIELGKQLNQRYLILDHVGHGGMQEVYRAKDLLLDIEIALKTPLAGQKGRRFAQSARLAARINHRNVAKTLDYVQSTDVVFLVEELVEGEDLESRLSKFGALDPHMGARILHHLAKGVAASHHAGVIHRDLKPNNVMVPRGMDIDSLKITDFGIATLTGQVLEEAHREGDITKSASGTVKGALPYMAPELMFRNDGDATGASCDVWSIGALMFRLLTGIYPFGVFLNAAVNVKTGTRAPWPPFMTQNPQFAPLATELQRLIEDCLVYDADERLSSDELVRRCEKLCYLAAPRAVGDVVRMIQKGASGFLVHEGEQVFFSTESIYGPSRRVAVGNKLCFSEFPGTPRNRAHPVVLMS